MEGKSEVIVLGGDIDGLSESERISADESGKCSYRIESITEEHLGTWACSLVDHTGDLFTGQIELDTIESECKKSGQVRAINTCDVHLFLIGFQKFRRPFILVLAQACKPTQWQLLK